MVIQVLHEVCERLGGPGFCVGVSQSGVNQADKGLGQLKQVMTAGTHGPSRQLIFDVVVPHIYSSEAALLRSSSELAPRLHVAAWVR